MDWIKFFSYSKAFDMAVEQLQKQFGIKWEPSDTDCYDVRWFTKRTAPFVMIRNIYQDGHLKEKEWYAYHSRKWNYIGKLSREESIDLYWHFKNDCYRNSKTSRNNMTPKQEERAAVYILDEYFKNYTDFGLH